MNSLKKLPSWKGLALACTFAGLALTQLSACNGIALPPIPITISLLSNGQVTVESAATGSADVVVGAFCDLFNEEQLDTMLRNAGGDLIADLVSIPRAELESVTITATQGNFSTFTSAQLDLSVLAAGAPALSLGTAENAAGLGASFMLTQEELVDLLNDLEDGQCGVPTLHLDGSAPSEDITFSATATVLVYSRLSLR